MPGFVFLRVRAHRLLLAAAMLTVLLTTAVLAALTAFSTTVGDAGLRHVLRYGSAADAALVVETTTLSRKELPAADRAVRAQAAKAYDGLPVTVLPIIRSGPFELPDRKRQDDDPDLTYFAQLDRGMVELLSGTWPAAAASGTVPIALPEVAARRLGLEPGDELTLKSRGSSGPARLRMSGVYRARDTTDPYWQLDDVAGLGVFTGGYTTYGPLMVDPGSFSSGALDIASGGWVLRADFSTVTADRLSALDSSVRAASNRLGSLEELSGEYADSRLDHVLDTAQRALLVNRSTLLIVALQLVLLAGYALLLVARLLSDERAGENDLLRARGGSRGRVAGLAALEALLIVAPSLIAAPLLAAPMIRLLSGSGPLARAGVEAVDDTGPVLWLVAAGSALGCALAVTAPALLRATGAASARTRAHALPAPLRAGADLGLLVVAGVAYWQLDRQTSDGGVLNTDTSGTLGVDPVLVAAPALALLAGTVLTLRLLPPTARLAERRAAAGRGLPTALAGWQLSRRPLRGAGPVLLLVMAVAMGLLAVAQGASWERSQRDQAAFRAGSDIRVLGSGRPGGYADTPGVAESSPAVRMTAPLSGGRSADVLALDTARAADGIPLRGDLADAETRALLPRLGGKSPKLRGFPLPAGAGRVEVTAQVGADRPWRGQVDLSALIQDRVGQTYELPLGLLAADGRDHRLTLDLAKPLTSGASPAPPLVLTGFTVDFDVPTRAASCDLEVSILRVTAAGRTTEPAPTAGLVWDVAADTGGNGIVEPPEAGFPVRGSAGTPLAFNFTTGASDTFGGTLPPGTLTVRARQDRLPPVPALATDTFLRVSSAKVGQRLTVPLGGTDTEVRIVGAVREFPTTGPDAISQLDAVAPGKDGGALIVDLAAANRKLAQADSTALRPSEWWLRTEPGQAQRTAAQLREEGGRGSADLVVREELAERLGTDPLGAGPQAALAATAVIAALLAALGFAVSAAASIRERGREFAVLRALGAPQRQLARMFAAEQSMLIAVALTAGTALGVVLSRAVVPLTTLTGAAAKPHPQVLVELPWAPVGLVVAGVAVMPLLITAAVALRRGDPATALRLGGE
ncbi:FtsX-like permease family protein [Streptomyces polyrhachis]|uniref:FtsX-like permease family protein n=1 Tax=Streptomyces polyrhachis TaxID=1282885 RepID=A0ABW2GJB4_9ACTN